MPQMMPLNWISMFLSLILIMSLFTIIMFNFIPTTPPTLHKKMFSTSMIKWVW